MKRHAKVRQDKNDGIVWQPNEEPVGSSKLVEVMREAGVFQTGLAAYQDLLKCSEEALDGAGTRLSSIVFYYDLSSPLEER